MEAQQLGMAAYETIQRFGYVDISTYVLRKTFEQKERKTSLGNGIMNFCGLPDERETYQRWLNANGWREIVLRPEAMAVRILPRESWPA